jgi:hypothetical protein
MRRSQIPGDTMSEHNDKSKPEAFEEHNIKRWNAKQYTVLVVEDLNCKTIAEVAHAPTLKTHNIELLKSKF